MMKNKISKFLLVAICLTLLVGVFVGCNNKVDEATLNALNDYFQGSEVEVVHSFGQYNDATVVLVKSQAIQDTLRKDTINGIEFNYASQTLLLVVKDSKVYMLKDAYLNLLLDSTTLREIQTTYNKKIKLESGAEYEEIGKEIVLEEKVIWDESALEDYETKFVEDDGFKIYYNKILIFIDYNFSNYHFSADDFSMVDIQKFDFRTELLFELLDNVFPDTFHHIISIEIDNNRKSMIQAIQHLQELDFVFSVEPEIEVSWQSSF